MKKSFAVISVVLVMLLSLGTLTAFASSFEEEFASAFEESFESSFEESFESGLQGESSEEIITSALEEALGEGAKELLPVVIVSTICLLSFFPALIVMIIFIVLNSKTKKQISEYERIYGPVENINMAPGFNPYMNQGNYNPYGVNNAPVQPQNTSIPSYIPQENNKPQEPTIPSYIPQENNQQGGQF